MYQTHIYGRFTLCFSRFSKLSSTQSASQFAEEPQRWQTAAPARWEIAAGCQAVTFSDRDSWIWSTNSARCEGFEVRWRDSTLGKPHSPAEFDSLPLQVEVWWISLQWWAKQKKLSLSGSKRRPSWLASGSPPSTSPLSACRIVLRSFFRKRSSVPRAAHARSHSRLTGS